MIPFRRAFLVAVQSALGLAGAAPGEVSPRYRLTDLSGIDPGATSSGALAVNDSGQVVGVIQRENGSSAFLWTPGAPNAAWGAGRPLPMLGPRNVAATALAINARGQVVGYDRETNQSEDRAVLWAPVIPHGETPPPVALPGPAGATFSAALAINDRGQIVGRGRIGASLRALLWNPASPNAPVGASISLGVLPGYADSVAYAINASGRVACTASGPGSRAMLWSPAQPNGSMGSLLGLDPPMVWQNGGLSLGISGSGEVVGSAVASSATRAVRWSPVQTPGAGYGATALDGSLPSSTQTFANAINSAGLIVGYSASPGGSRAVQWAPTAGVLDLTSVIDASGGGWTLNQARAINARGQIAGWGAYDPDGPGPAPGSTRAFLLTPLPVCSRADTNNDGRQTVQDIFDFLAAWSAGGILIGNYNSDCCVSMQDVLDFLRDWFAGCG